MTNLELKQLVNELIIKEKWAEFLKRFIDVLRINIFLIDFQGKLLLPPLREGENERYGGKFLSISFGFDFTSQESNLLEAFESHGPYLEAKDPFDFHAFAIPVRVDKKIIAFMIVGPVILNKGWQNDDYINLASRLNINVNALIDAIHEVRVVSFVTMKAILDLLSEVVKNIVELSFEQKKLHQVRFNKDILPKGITETANNLYKSIVLDELLVTILDVALNLTQAECGSIMILDDKKGDLAIKVSRGLDQDKIKSTSLKIGEGIAGVAAKENTSFFISGLEGDNRIRHLLKRVDIKQSLVLPLSYQNRVLGVLNLHTKKEENKIYENVNNLKNFSKLISVAIKSI